MNVMRATHFAAQANRALSATIATSMITLMGAAWIPSALAQTPPNPNYILDGTYNPWGNRGYGSYEYSAPIDIPFLRMGITYKNTDPVNDWRVMPEMTHSMTSSGYQGFKAEFSLGPGLNDTRDQDADWSAQFPSVNPPPNYYRYKDIGPLQSWSIAFGVWSFNSLATGVEGDLFGGSRWGSGVSYKITLFDPGTTPGLSASHPIQPSASDPEKGFLFNLALGTQGSGVSFPVFIDPEFAVGYSYSTSGPNFASVLVPDPLPHGDKDFELTAGSSTYPLTAGVPFDLTKVVAGGTSSFMITGIDAQEGLVAGDPPAFVTGLTFVGAGNPQVAMKAVVPEPSTLVLLWGLGATGLIAAWRGRRRAA